MREDRACFVVRIIHWPTGEAVGELSELSPSQSEVQLDQMR